MVGRDCDIRMPIRLDSFDNNRAGNYSLLHTFVVDAGIRYRLIQHDIGGKNARRILGVSLWFSVRPWMDTAVSSSTGFFRLF